MQIAHKSSAEDHQIQWVNPCEAEIGNNQGTTGNKLNTVNKQCSLTRFRERLLVWDTTGMSDQWHISSADMGNQVDTVFLDLAKVFDRLPHHTFLLKEIIQTQSMSFNIYLDSQLSNQYNTICRCKWDFIYAIIGILGDSSGLCYQFLLFLIVVNDLQSGILSRVQLFASDCMVCCTISHSPDYSAVQDNLNKIWQRCVKWKLLISLDKSKVLLFRCCKTVEQSYCPNPTECNVSCSQIPCYIPGPSFP